MKEIEKKFLIKRLPEGLENCEKVRIEQGYLNTSDGPTLRIRRQMQEYILCYKSKMKSEENVAIVCKEEELPLTKEAYNHLKDKIDGSMITKTRYLIPLKDELTAELDIFDGYLEGLRMVEVEFENEEMATRFTPPNWFGKDVTFDPRFRNSYLSSILDVSEILEK